MDKQIKLFPVEKIVNHHPIEKQTCSSCDNEIGSEISRIILMRNIDRGPRLFCFHFFYPCWDFKSLCRKFPNLTIETVGFSIPENVMMEKRSIKEMKKNIELWT